MIDGLTFFWLVLRASLLSSGGLGNLPLLHQDLLARHWASDRDFASALAIGQVAPGPNGLWVVALGFLVYGLPGAALSAVAVVARRSWWCRSAAFTSVTRASRRSVGSSAASPSRWRGACPSSSSGSLTTATASTGWEWELSSSRLR